MGRDYKKEYDEYHSKPEQRRNRSSRNKARRALRRARGERALMGMDVDHKDGNPLNNSAANLRIMSPSKNRAKH